MNWHRIRTAVVAGTAAAVAGGVAAAILARLLMRAATLAVGSEPGFSLLGTTLICVVFVMWLLPGAITMAATPRRWAWAVLALGTATLATQAVAIGLQDLEGQFLTTRETVLLAGIGTAMAAVLLGQLLLVGRWARRGVRRVEVSERVAAR